MKLRFTSRAHRDVDEAAAFYGQKSVRVAAEFLLAVDVAAAFICNNPQAWPKVSRELRRQVMRRFPYSLYYRLAADEVLIVAVLHAKRDPGIWRARE